MLDSLKKIYSLFPRKDRFKLWILFGMMLVASIFEVLGIGMIPAFVIAVAEPDAILQMPVVGDWLKTIGITTARELVIYGALLLILIYIMKNSYLIYFHYIKQKFVSNRGVYLQDRIFRAYMTSPYTFYLSRNSAELLRNVTAEVGKIINGTLMPFMEITLQATMFVFIMGTLLYMEPLITVVTMVLLGGGGYVFLRFTQKKTRQYGKDDREARKRMNKTVLQGLGGFKDARVLNREKMFLMEYTRNAEISKHANVYQSVIKKLPRPIIETLMVIGILAITLIMVLEGRSFSTIIPILTLFGAAAVKLMPVLNNSIGQITTIRYSAYSVYAVYDDLKLLEGTFSQFRQKVLASTEKLPLEEQIELKSVTYNYPESEEHAVRDISLTIPRGNAIAFVGPSGAGKTTLVDIILGLLVPQKGTIEVDGKDIYDDIRGWMKNIGYIPQSIYLLDDSIRRNIAFGIPEGEVDEEKLRNAIRAAQLDELIERLPKREHTIVGERGVRLSGGQQQRIGIARALYDNPQVLIMDEATSALDNITEKYVIEAIEKLRGDRTIIMIAHRLTTVRNCDTIYMLDESRLVGQGTYDELLETNAEFRRMSLVDD